MNTNLRITALELEAWEHQPMKDAFPNAQIFSQPISDGMDLGDPEALAIFIYSKIGPTELGRMPHLKYITTMSTGYDHIDLEACRQRGIVVSNVPAYGEQTVAEHALALLLALTRNIVPAVAQTKRGDFSVEAVRGTDLGGKTAGVVGTGRIGKHVIAMLKGIGMNVIAFDPFPNPTAAKDLGFTYVDLDSLLKTSDIVTLHCPANKNNEHLLTEEKLLLMKRDAFLINTARGGLVDTQALVRVLGTGHLAGVGLDVLEEEQAIKEERQLLSSTFQQQHDMKTMLADHVLLQHPRVLITPHNAFNSHESVRRILNTTIENINAFAAGTPQNLIH
jgi:D-lactate dehydrogenase